jgi:hypothetical protein
MNFYRKLFGTAAIITFIIAIMDYVVNKDLSYKWIIYVWVYFLLMYITPIIYNRLVKKNKRN